MTKQLDEVNIIRPAIIVMLVVMHSFTIYAGGWHLPVGIEYINAYAWIQRIAYSFMLEMFVFISGYIFAYQIYYLKRPFSFKGLIHIKFNRLIIPSISFSLLYALFFYKKEFHVGEFLYDIVCGLGHLWFLPMLFWCFVFTFLFFNWALTDLLKLCILLVISVFSFIPLPLGMAKSLYFLFFFYWAFYFWKHRLYVEKHFTNLKFVILVFFIFILMFVPLVLLREYLLAEFSIAHNSFDKIFWMSLANLCRIIYALIGVSWGYITAIYLSHAIKIPLWLSEVNKLCMGVYIFHQFFLQIIYYYTSIPTLLGSYWLPWFGVCIALTFSLLLTFLFRKIKLGRRLL